MTLPLSPVMLARAYDYLRSSPPFIEWRLPPSRTLLFRVTRHADRFSHVRGYIRSQGAEIAVSERKVGSSRVLIECMAHEMIHLHQHLQRSETPKTQHNAEFEALADLVCRLHGFDRKTF
ncbi:MAG: SprT-like domain-containing protein [Alphaproteobacteria bacterium]|nr:SprT-like domain-containing protein [Alphaproteobacteria bacterium]